ncbi:STAS domain-containing protein [Anaeromyxobacter oryzae]|uniref:STAS domain-containing protein n=1 Tax=Anaeromyxobacter oryzae TaxID=2918170 RepID=A0ABN6MX50_9BACT|nr:STAS domain-containing protein [Anaeromyxobacter oryzae]BDG04424.1 hypothetical protein AMOR_34200 [Anaeromyxobacter oryzae]
MQETKTTPRLIRLDGVLDASAADRLAELLADPASDGDVRVDLSHVRAFDDFAVMVLGRALAACGARVTVQGLREHHVRLLRYLGITPGLGEPARARA